MWLSNNKTRFSILIMLIDVLIVNLSIILAYLIRFNLTLPAFKFHPYLQILFWLSRGCVFFFNTYHLYSVSPRTRWDDQFYSIIFAIVLTLMLSISLTYISANYSFPRSVFLISGILQVSMLSLWRYFLWRLTKLSLGVQRAVIIGGFEDSVETAERFKKFSESHIDIVGLITDEDPKIEDRQMRYAILGRFTEFSEILRQTDCEVVVVTPYLDAELKEKVVCYCYSLGKEVFLIPDLYEVLVIKANLNLIDDVPVFGVQNDKYEHNPIKRILDLVLGTAAFVFTLPVMIIVGS
ncbi:MAG: nucleoside-diphosphate sugar epimerase/dehydratase, partial [Eubacteriales bacterium]